MLTEAALQELASFQATRKNASVLSLYLNVDKHRPSADYKLVLRNLLDSVSDEVDRATRERVERFMDHEYDWQGRGLACFSCAEEDFWQAYPLMVPVDDMVFVGHRPYLKPLSDLLDTYARYGVVLVDREGAHIFLFNMGALEEVTGVTGEDVKRHKQGGWASARYQRHEDEAAARNLKEAAEMTTHFVRDGSCRHLILGGTDGNVSHFAALLPKSVHQLVVGSIAADMTASPAEIGEKSLALIKEEEASRKSALVNELVTTAAKGGPAALGLSNTLAAAYAGRAYHLVLDDSFVARAYRCDNCGYVGTEELAQCPLCEHELRLLPDAADSLVRWAIVQDLDLTLVPHDPELIAAGAVGAFLRY